MTQSRPEIAVGGIVVHDEKLLMVKRATPPAQGLWTVPGGRVELGEYMVDAVRREVREETGLDVEVGELAGMFEVLGDPHYVIFDFLAAPTGATEVAAADDASEVRWVPLDEVGDLECTPRFVELLTAWGVLS